MREDLAKELQKIGLSENEAKVYLAGLELGPSTAQMIAAKATVSRPTTYIMIESLIKRGLMSSFQKGKKRFFVSGKPAQLLYILEQQKRIIEVQTETMKKIVSRLEVREDSDLMPVVVYEGLDSTREIQNYLSQNTEELLEMVPEDLAREYIPPIYPGDVRENFSRKFKIKSLYTNKQGVQGKKKENVEFRFLSPDKFPIKSEVLIAGNRVFLSNFDSRHLTIQIIDKKIADSFRAIFYSVWETAQRD
jgi:sugar-specific transcriptional regulator TrmB